MKDEFKNSPMHNKVSIIELMDSFSPGQMVVVVDFLQIVKKKDASDVISLPLHENYANRLIRLGNDNMINTSEIKKVSRCGNYTELSIKGELSIRQIWDEDRKIINQLDDI